LIHERKLARRQAKMVVPSPTDMPKYVEDRIRLDQAVKALGRGSKAQASYALKVSPTTISRVLSGNEVNRELLDRIEEWVASVTQTTQRVEASVATA
jgi:hypothetical protein